MIVYYFFLFHNYYIKIKNFQDSSNNSVSSSQGRGPRGRDLLSSMATHLQEHRQISFLVGEKIKLNPPFSNAERRFSVSKPSNKKATTRWTDIKWYQLKFSIFVDYWNEVSGYVSMLRFDEAGNKAKKPYFRIPIPNWWRPAATCPRPTTSGWVA